jgi:hypothetical protein
VAALASTWLARGERPTQAELAGGVVIIAGLMLAVVPLPSRAGLSGLHGSRRRPPLPACGAQVSSEVCSRVPRGPRRRSRRRSAP